MSTLSCCCCAVLLLCSGVRAEGPEAGSSSGRPDDLASLVRLLDADDDGLLSPYEGAESIIRLLQRADIDESGSVGLSELRACMTAQVSERRAEAVAMHGDLDANSDGVLNLGEVPEDYLSIVEQADGDGDGVLSIRELEELRFDSETMVRAEAQVVLEMLDDDKDGVVSRGEVPQDEIGLFVELDADHDGLVSVGEIEAAMLRENSSATFEVDGARCIMTGVIGPSTPARMLELIVEHPDVRTIVLLDVPGSMDDPSNLRAARMVHRHGFTTIVPHNGEIASGGVDFFLAGVVRVVERGGALGVHSWSDGSRAGSAFPRDDSSHEQYLEFYREVEVPEAFYWYTLESASPDDVHWMTRAEMDRFGVERGTPK